ncbi:hypothetical protein J4422_00700 [Candidatus Pacearchaeota archaeon]|nr:hypothetical protein [Candidatus Pacearchaeota archaeon]
MLQKIREVYEKSRDYVKELAFHTKAEIAVGAVAGAIALGAFGHAKETYRAAFQPISFSEYEQVEDNARNTGREINDLTWFYVGVNDFTSKIAEAYNWNSVWSSLPNLHRRHFAFKLDEAMDTTGRLYRRNIRDFAKIIPKHGRGALKELSDLVSASQESNNLRENVRQTWNYDYDEQGHWYTTESCTTDSQGNTSCTTTWHYQCDYYHHTWTHHPKEGAKTSQELTKAKEKVPGIKRLKIETPGRTEAWNEQVIRESFKKLHKREPTEQEMLQAAQFYKTGSQYELNIDEARSLWTQITNQDSQQWQRYLSTAKTTRKTTGCHSTSGPAEYEFAQEVQGRLGDFIEHEQNITNGMKDAIYNIPKIENKIKIFFLRQNPTMTAHYPEIKEDEIKGSKSKLARQVISDSRKLYQENIPNGNPDTSYRLWLPFLFSLLGGTLGGLAGWGADALIDRVRR